MSVKGILPHHQGMGPLKFTEEPPWLIMVQDWGKGMDPYFQIDLPGFHIGLDGSLHISYIQSAKKVGSGQSHPFWERR
jgi:hypothetical protein